MASTQCRESKSSSHHPCTYIAPKNDCKGSTTHTEGIAMEPQFENCELIVKIDKTKHPSCIRATEYAEKGFAEYLIELPDKSLTQNLTNKGNGNAFGEEPKSQREPRNASVFGRKPRKNTHIKFDDKGRQTISSFDGEQMKTHQRAKANKCDFADKTDRKLQKRKGNDNNVDENPTAKKTRVRKESDAKDVCRKQTKLQKNNDTECSGKPIKQPFLQNVIRIDACSSALKNSDVLQDLCTEIGRKSPQFKQKCDIFCDEIRLLEGVLHVYPAYKLNDINSVTFVVTIENDQDKLAVETYLKGMEIEYDIKLLQFKSNETTSINHKRKIPSMDLEIEKLRDCINTHAPQLFFKHQYLSIVQGCLRHVINKETDITGHYEAYLELYVHAKKCIPIQEDPFEKMYNGIPVHVREGVFLPFTKHADDIHDNIRMGCAISRSYQKSGTLGLFVEHNKYGLCGIASAHVLLCDKELEQCTKQLGKYLPKDQKEVYQPCFPDYIGHVVEVMYKEGNCSEPGLEIGLIAIDNRKPENGRFPEPKSGKELDINYSSGRADIPRENNSECRKFGSATNYTTGIIESLTLPNVVRTLPCILKSGSTEYKLFNQLRIEPCDQTDPLCGRFADFGDSGASVFVIDGDGQPVCVGIIAGGISDCRTVMVTPIAVILQELGISKFKTLKPNLEKLQQDIHAIKHQLFELAQHLLPQRGKHSSE